MFAVAGLSFKDRDYELFVVKRNAFEQTLNNARKGEYPLETAVA